MKTTFLAALLTALAFSPVFASANAAEPASMEASVTVFPEGYVPAPTGDGWRDGMMWRETDAAGKKIVRCMAMGREASLFAAPTGLHKSCNGSERNFEGWSELNNKRVISDREGNRWTVYILANEERWTDAAGNVTSCKYSNMKKTCKFPDPATLKVEAPTANAGA